MTELKTKVFQALNWRRESTLTTTAGPSDMRATFVADATPITGLEAALEPIMGFVPEVSRFITCLTPLARELDTYQKEIRATIMFIIDIAQVTTKQAFFCRVFSYIDTLCPKITGDMLKFSLRREFGNLELDSQAGEDWMDQVKWAIGNWKMATTSPLRRSLHKLAGFLAWAVIGSQVPEGVFAKGFGSLYESSGLSRLDALDFPTHVLECFVTVFTNLREAVRTGSFMAFFGQDKLVTAQLDHARLMAQVTSFMLGTLEQEDPPTSRQQYLRDIQAHVESLQEQVKTSRGPVGGTFAKMLQQAQARYSEVLAFNRASYARMTAFALCFWGASSVAKSTLLPIVITFLLRANGFAEPGGETDPLLVGTHNSTDKYHSGLKASDLVTVLDDLGNTQPQHTEGDPSAILLDAINTAPRLMNKAEVEQKGKVPFQAPFVIVTTNDRTMGAATYSVNPTSRLRRITVYIEVKIREEYRMSDSAMLDPTKVPAGDPNIWEFNVATYTPLAGARSGVAEQGNWKPAMHKFEDSDEAVELTRIGIADLLAFLEESSRLHFERERRLMMQNNDYHRRGSCTHGGLGGILCRKCSRAALSSQGLFEYLRGIRGQEAPVQQLFDPPPADPPEDHTARQEWARQMELQYAAAASMRGLVAESRTIARNMFGVHPTEPLIMHMLHMWPVDCGRLVTHPALYIAASVLHCSLLFVLPLWLFWWRLLHVSTLILFSLAIVACVTAINWRSVSAYVWSHMDLIAISAAKRRARVFWRARSGRLKLLLMVLTCAYFLYKFVMRLWRNLSPTAPVSVPTRARGPQLAHQGGVITTPSVPEIITRPWQERMAEAVPVGGVAKTMSCAQGLERIRHSLAWGVFIGPEKDGIRKRLQVDVLGIESGLFVVPTHVRRKLGEGNISVTLSFAPSGLAGTSFKSEITSRSWCDMPGKDLSLVDIPVGRMLRCNLDLFPLALPTRNLPVRSIHRNADGELEHTAMYASASRVNMPETEVDTAALEYHYGSPTGPGLCGMLLFADCQPTFIAGIHIAGENGLPRGVASCITRTDVEQAKERLRADGVVPLMPKFRQIDLSLNGVVKLHPSDVVVPKSATRFLDPESEFTYLGAHTKGSRSFHSDIAETRCAGLVAEIFPDAQCIFGPPRNLSNARTWTYNMGLAADPARIPPDIQEMAEKDYRLTWERIFKAHPGYEKDLGVVDDSTAINGINGIPELSPIDMSTSQGWPVNRPKTELFYKPGVATPTVLDPWEAPPQFYEDARKLQDHLALGNFVPFVFRASLKDEPTKKTKEWPRMFCGAPVMYTFLMRKYFCLLFAWLKRHKFAFGGMCGINAYGREWDKMCKFVTSFGMDRMVAGDFKHFDKKAMRPVIRFLLSMVMWVAKHSGVYTARDLSIMESLLSALTWVIVEVNGEFYLLGGNPSGHVITVELNDFINGFELRCVFYSLLRELQERSRPRVEDVVLEDWATTLTCHGYNPMEPLAAEDQIVPGVNGLFCAYVRLVTYGDDNLMGVARNCDFFNHTAIAGVFAPWGIEYTMADKTSASVPYLHFTQTSFLKRTPRFDPKWQVWMAPLEPLSMVKALMVRNTKSALSHDEHIATNVENCLREAFFHGAAEYEKWLRWCTELVDRLSLWHHFPEPDLPGYDFWSDWWLESFAEGKLTPQSLEDDLGYDSGESEIELSESTDPLHYMGSEWPADLRQQLIQVGSTHAHIRGNQRLRMLGSHVYVWATHVAEAWDDEISSLMVGCNARQGLVLHNHAGQARVVIMQLSRPVQPIQYTGMLRRSHFLVSTHTVGPLHVPRNGQVPGSFAMVSEMFLATQRYQRGVRYCLDGRKMEFVWRDLVPWTNMYIAPVNLGGDLQVDISESGSVGPNTN